MVTKISDDNFLDLSHPIVWLIRHVCSDRATIILIMIILDFVWLVRHVCSDRAEISFLQKKTALKRSGLEKGLRFAIVPSKIPTAQIVAVVEESIFQLNDDHGHLVRAGVSSILKRAIPPPKNIQKDLFNALIALEKDPGKLVSSANKGN